MTAPAPARVAAVACLALLASLLPVLTGPGGAAPASTAAAATAAGFDPGNIISDPVFRDADTMDAGAVQAFLEARVPQCAAGATCLRDYRENTWTRPAAPGLCREYEGRIEERASQIVARVARACSINPQVLLVLLQKEQALVTATAPVADKFRRATGFGCPDTAPCNAEYFGFFNQVYLAARQYLVYANNPTRYGYQAGRTNTVRYHPDAACGSREVFIANQATAGLYNYTPYQPNAAALANLYGSGDACSAYGNRNFWRLFTDWFGNPQAGGFLVRSAADPAVYLIAGERKLPVPDMGTARTYSALGSIGVVSQRYLDALPTGAALTRAAVGPDGRVHLVSENRKHYVSSCELLTHHGLSCAELSALTAVQLSTLATGPDLARAFTTPGSSVLWVAERGTRREVIDYPALAAAGLPSASVALGRESTGMPVGRPVVQPGTVMQVRESGERWLLHERGTSFVPEDLWARTQVRRLPAGALGARSVQALLPPAPTHTGLVTGGDGGLWMLTGSGRAPVAGAVPPTGVTRWSRAMLDAVPVHSPGGGYVTVQAPGQETVYLLDGASKRPVASWAALVAVSSGRPEVLFTSASALDALPTGPSVLAPGSLVKASSADDVWLVDGIETKHRLPSFEVSDALGVRGLTTAPASVVGAYTARGDLTTTTSCASVVRVGVAGTSRPLRGPAGIGSSALQETTCRALRSGGEPVEVPLHVRAAGSGTVFQLSAGVKRPVASWPALVRAAGPDPLVVVVAPSALAAVPAGAPIP